MIIYQGSSILEKFYNLTLNLKVLENYPVVEKNSHLLLMIFEFGNCIKWCI